MLVVGSWSRPQQMLVIVKSRHRYDPRDNALRSSINFQSWEGCRTHPGPYGSDFRFPISDIRGLHALQLRCSSLTLMTWWLHLDLHSLTQFATEYQHTTAARRSLRARLINKVGISPISRAPLGLEESFRLLKPLGNCITKPPHGPAFPALQDSTTPSKTFLLFRSVLHRL